RLAYVLYAWREFANDEGVEVRAWTTEQMNDDRMIATFSERFTSFSWSQSLGVSGLGDSVAKRNTRAEIGSLDTILDVPTFRARVEEVAAKNAAGAAGDAVRNFLAAWRRREENPREVAG